MFRTLMLGGAAWRCAILVSCLSVTGPSQVSAQTSPVAQPVPGLDGIASASIRQITRDGTRIVVGVAPSGGTAYTLVLDTRTGATVFDSRPVQSYERTYATATLSPDGAFLADGVTVAGSGVRVTQLSSGKEQVAFHTATSGVQVRAVSDGGTLVGAYDPHIPGYSYFGVGGAGQPLRTFGAPCPPDMYHPPGTSWRVSCTGDPLTMTADGAQVAFKQWWLSSDNVTHYGLMVGDVAAERSSALPITHPELGPELHPPLPWRDVKISGEGHWIGFTGRTRSGDEPKAALAHRLTGQTVIVAAAVGRTYFHDVSDDARFVLLTGEYSPVTGQQLWVVDRLSGLGSKVHDPLDTPLGRYRVLSAHLSGDGRTIVATLGDGTTSDPTPQRTFIARLDSDGDGMHDSWEMTFGLDPSRPADAAEDPDGDGVTSLQEHAVESHPRGTPVRYFAEGANGAFFATSLSLFNPSTEDVTANVRFLGPVGAMAAMPVVVPGRRPASLEVDRANLPFTEFSFVLESPVQLVAERRMTWDRSGKYGSHSGTGVEIPSTTWHFAEGATIAGLQTFFLLQNPGDEPATATLRYLLSTGTVHERTHTVPARSRITVWANRDGAPLDAAEFAMTVASDLPLVAERAMYRDAPGELFSAGSVMAGVASPGTSWLFAEGATGSFFDTYLLLANPGDAATTVSVEFLRAFALHEIATAAPISRQYVVAPHSRRTVWVAREDDTLRDAQVSMRVTASAPLVAERAMWWPGPTPATWRESHAGSGTAPASVRWGVADIQVDAESDGWDTFLLVYGPPLAPSNSGTGPLLHAQVACEDGTRVERTLDLAPYRVTLWLRYVFPEIVGKRCGALLESLERRITLSPLVPQVRVPVHVEKAMYRGQFAAGSASAATRLPDPP